MMIADAYQEEERFGRPIQTLRQVWDRGDACWIKKDSGPECSKAASETPNLAGGVRFSPGSPFEVKERKDMTIPDANLNTSKTAGSVRLVLGWANGWTDEPQIVKDCKAENHPFKERNLDPTMHGFDHLVWCNICGYEYHYDSSG